MSEGYIGSGGKHSNDGVYLYLSVMDVVDNSNLEAKIVGIISDDGGNVWVCREALKSKYTNDSVFPPLNPLFTMDRLAHILEGACKAGVQ